MGFPNNEKMTEGLTFLSTKSGATNTTTLTSAAVDLSKVRKVTTVFWVGALAASEVATCTLQGCATSGGSYTTITGSSVTLTKVATDDNKFRLVETNAENVNALGLGYKFLQATITCAVGSPAGFVMIGGGGPEEPIAAQNSTSVKAITLV